MVAGKLAANAVTTDTLANSAVTPGKLADHIKIGSFTPTGTGNLTISGIGFKPQLVKFTVTASDATAAGAMLLGAMDKFGNQYIALTTQGSRIYRKTYCLGYIGGGSTSLTLAATYVSMNADGFTINISANNGNEVYYEAYG